MRFRILNQDYLYDYREDNKITEGILLDPMAKRPYHREDMTAFWIKQIIANHSTLRSIHFRLIDERPKSVVMQLIRATKGHPQPEVESSRPDWTGTERSSDPYEEKLFAQDHTAESFIEMAKQRLCHRTEAKTRMAMAEMVKALRRDKDPFLRALGYCCAPACSWYGHRCPEIKSCGKCPKLSDEIEKLYCEDNGLPLFSKREEAEIAMERR